MKSFKFYDDRELSVEDRKANAIKGLKQSAAIMTFGFVLFGIFVVVLIFMFIFSAAGNVETNAPVNSQPSANSSFSFLCSKRTTDGHLDSYFTISSGFTPATLSLHGKIKDVTVRLSKGAGTGEWDTNFLCSPESSFDLAASDWKVLTIGSDCGLGAAVDPCDVEAMSDATGVSGFVFGKSVNGYVTRVIGDYFGKGALIKVSGIPIN